MRALTRISIALALIGAALVAAGLIADIAHSELGLSPLVIRKAALLASGMLGIALYSQRFGKWR
jgi:hypothetical protein